MRCVVWSLSTHGNDASNLLPGFPPTGCWVSLPVAGLWVPIPPDLKTGEKVLWLISAVQMSIGAIFSAQFGPISDTRVPCRLLPFNTFCHHSYPLRRSHLSTDIYFRPDCLDSFFTGLQAPLPPLHLAPIAGLSASGDRKSAEACWSAISLDEYGAGFALGQKGGSVNT